MAAAWNFRGQNLLITEQIHNSSYIFGPPPALGISSSSLGSVESIHPKFTNMEAAPFTGDDIGPILDILSRCPEDISFSRVFKQHPELGTCWFDSFLMMVFENSDVKPFILPFVEVALQTLLANGIQDLGYSSPIDKTPEEIAREKMFRNETEETDPINLRTTFKIQIIAKVFQRITGSPDTIPIEQWNFFAYVIHKYILLAYLFLKGGTVEPRLQKRRGSINMKGHNSIHSCLRQTIGAYYCGAEDRSIQDVLVQFSQLLQFITKGTFTIVPFEAMKEPLPRRGWKPPFPNTWKNVMDISNTGGYYVVVNRKDNFRFGHVLSLYKCGGRWTLFDNQAEIVPLGADSSARLSAVGIKGIEYEIRKKEVQYTITYGDDTTEALVTPLEVEQCRESTYLFSKGASYKLVRLAAAGGRRRRATRKQCRRGTRKIKKQKV